MNTSSAADCTGLIPAEPQSQSEYDNYAELYEFLPPSCADAVRRHDG